jgi:hypothetical protein
MPTVNFENLSYLVEPPVGHCKDCMYCKEQHINAKGMEDFFGNPVVWDSKLCYYTCWKRAPRKWSRRES